jgi:DNA-binding GntR family transcriptional regulator
MSAASSVAVKHEVTSGEGSVLGEVATDHSPISRVIHRRLREAILTGALRPGQVLRQEELARHFGASRAPLREALNVLEAEGLVELRPRRGFAVTSLDARELLEVLQLRIVLEEHAAYVATQTRKPEDVQKLREALRAMDGLAKSAPDQATLAQWSVLNRGFHDTLEAASGRRHLCQLASNVRAKVEPYIRLEVSMTRGLDESQQDHHRIFEAFEAGDAGTVAQLCRAHCEHTARRLISALHARGSAVELTSEAVSDTGTRVRGMHRAKLVKL